MTSYPYFGSHRGGSGYSGGHRSTSGGSSRHTIRVYEGNDECTPSYSKMRSRDRRRSTSGEDKYYTSSSANRSSHSTASYRESLPSYGSSSRRDDYRAYDVSSLREALPSYGTTSYRDDYKKHDRSSSRRESLPTSGRTQHYFYDKYGEAKPRQSKYRDEVNDSPTTSKSRHSKYEFYDEVDDYPKSSKSRQSKYHDEVDDYPIKSKSRHSKYEYYNEVDDYPTTSKSHRSKNDYYDEVDGYPKSSKSRQAKYYDEVDDYPSARSTRSRRASPSWREEVSAHDYIKELVKVAPSTSSTSDRLGNPSWCEEVSAVISNDYDKVLVNVTSSDSRTTPQSEFLQRTFDCEDAEGRVEAFMQRNENNEPDVVSGTFSFKRKQR